MDAKILALAALARAGRGGGGGGGSGTGLPAVNFADVFPETAVPFTYEEGMGYAVFQYAPAPYTLTAGETYFVVADGATYKCVAKELEGIVFIGDEGVAVTGVFQGDYPFVLAWIPETDDAVLFAIYNSTADISVNIRMYQCADDGKFLRVVGGEPVWAAVENAEEASF